MYYFQITVKPVRSLMKVEGVEVVQGTKYPVIALPNITIENETLYLGEPFDSFKYKIFKDTLSSVNEGTVVINFETNKTGMPPIVNATKDLTVLTSFSASELILPDSHFDRITVTSIAGNGTWFFNSVALAVGQIIFMYDIANIVFQANTPIVGLAYGTITWNTENKNGPHAQTNTIVVNTTGSISTDFYFEGRWDAADTVHLPSVNSWVDYVDDAGVTQRFIVGAVENGCQLVSAVSILDYNGCDPCTPV